MNTHSLFNLLLALTVSFSFAGSVLASNKFTADKSPEELRRLLGVQNMSTARGFNPRVAASKNLKLEPAINWIDWNDLDTLTGFEGWLETENGRDRDLHPLFPCRDELPG